VTAQAGRPRLGFLGLGRIGQHRLLAVRDAGVAEIVAVADSAAAARAEASALVPEAHVGGGLSDLLAHNPDGVVIATPSAQHAAEAITALRHGAAVFCQKPLARTRRETCDVLEASRAADRLLGVDFSYRRTQAMTEIASLVRAGEIGKIYAADLVFHNAYGPDREWFYDPSRSGGGCLIDLGTHLIDLALWLADSPVAHVTSRLFAGGMKLPQPPEVTEDFALAQLDLESGASITISCSWKLSAGRDAVIDCRWFGTRGGARFANVDGSFFDFVAERFDGTRTVRLASPPDSWGGRTIVAWAEQLGRHRGYDPAAAGELERVADVLDSAYGRSSVGLITDDR
jgi:predicted dehydrogenase